MNIISHKLCSIQGRLFELSVKCGYESNGFVRTYMHSDIAAKFNSAYDRSQWMGEEYLLDELANTFHLKKGETYSYDVMFWMGYTYASWAIIYVESCPRIYRFADARKMAENYAGLHTVSVELAVQDLIMQYYFQRDNGKQLYDEIVKKVLKDAINSRPGITDYEKYINSQKVDLACVLRNEISRIIYLRDLDLKRNDLIRREHINYINYILDIIAKSNMSYKEKTEYSFVVRDIASKAVNYGFTKAQIVFIDSLISKLSENK